MKMAFWQRLTVLTLLGLGANSLSFTAQAAQFEQQEVDQGRFIVLAAPGGDINKDGAIDYKLLILEQLKDERPCWNETGGQPSSVDPLLLNFDFTGICNRLIDSNGFSVRTGGTDQALQYNLRIIREDNDLVLVAASTTDRDDLVEVGRTHGVPTGFSRIILDSGWRLTRRAFNGRAVGHIYLTYDQPMDSLLATSRYVIGVGRQPSAPNPVASPADALTPGSIPPDSPIPGSTPGSMAPFPPPGTTVIPVPSLPPAPLPANPTPSPTNPGSPSPFGPSGSSQGTASPPPLSPSSQTPSTGGSSPPNLSTLLPPPPPVGSELPLESSPSSSGSAIRPSTQTAAGGSATPVATPPPSSTSPRSSTATSENPPAGRTITRTPSRVPTASNSGGALLRPQSRRSNAVATNSNQRSTSRSSSTNSSTNSATNSTTDSAAGSAGNSTSTSSTTSSIAQAETYQVVVVADSAETQDKVRSLAPSAFLTTINGQVVMQVGIFRDRQEADQLQQRLSLEGLPTAVISVR